MTKHTDLAREIFKASYLTGNFTLRSGLKSTEYFDKYKFESDPKLLSRIAEAWAPLIPTGTEVLAGLELGGVPLATALSLKTGIPTAFVRKQAKDYGTCLIAEGHTIKDKKVLIIEDVITTGGQVKLSCADLRQHGALVEDVFCVILRAPSNPLSELGLKLHALFTMEELKNAGS